MQILGVDVGGSSIKAAQVDVETARIGKRIERACPDGFGCEAIVEIIADLVDELGGDEAVGVGFPAVVQNGVVRSPATSHQVVEWMDFELSSVLSERVGRRVAVLNDGDAAGLSEMRFGAGENRDGVVMVFTLGTGIGSALFIDGVIVPNLELGRLYLGGQALVAEYQAAARVRTDEELSWSEWTSRMQRYFSHIERVFSPEFIIVGGGVSDEYDNWMPGLDLRAEIVPAAMRNNAGLIGAALAATAGGVADS
ncbi:MAG: polyphosphate--glucose phosphotransferase [Acidimicrobiales bacterium]